MPRFPDCPYVAARPLVITTWLMLATAFGIAGCSDADSSTGPSQPPVPSVTGTVTSSATGDPVPGAEVSIGSVKFTTGVDGRFELSPLVEGSDTIRCVAAGFETFEAAIDIPADRVDNDIRLTREELFEFGDFALFVPATVSKVRAILVALGGPDTRGFASDSAFGAPVPEVEAALHALGKDFRDLAREKGLAVLGTSRAALPNSPESDELLYDAIAQGAVLSGRTELEGASFLVYGMSGGAPEASGLTARIPGRVAGLFLKVPETVETLSDGPVLNVPTYLVLAEMDAFVDNDALYAAFSNNRATGALWALAMEPGVIHFSLTPAQRALTIDWMRTILGRRIWTSGPSQPVTIDPASGWLGDMGSGFVYSWAQYVWDRSAASWFPSFATANQWRTFTKPLPGLVSRIDLAPQAVYLETGGYTRLVMSIWDEEDRPVYMPVAFSSDDEDVAAVGAVQQDFGCLCEFVVISARGAGTAVITAEVEGVTATATVHVLPENGPLSLHPDTLTLRLSSSSGEYPVLGYLTVLGLGDAQPPYQAVSYSSQNETVASVHPDMLCEPLCGYVYVAAHAPGSTTITAEWEGMTATATVVVEP